MSPVNVRYMVDEVDAAIAFYTTHLGFQLLTRQAPAFADVKRGDLRLLLSARTSAAGRPRARTPPRPPAGAGGMESHPSDRGRHRGRGGAAAGRRGAVPKRYRQGARRVAGPHRRPPGQSDRALPARGALSRGPRARPRAVLPGEEAPEPLGECLPLLDLR